MNLKFRTDGISGPAFRLVAGRVIGGVVSFAIPVVLARILLPAAFGTYKQLFLIYATLFGLAQLGAAESLYYFVPSKPAEAGRSVCNAVGTLALVGTACLGVLYLARTTIAGWLGNAELANHLPLVGLFLTLTLVSAAFEIVMVSRKEPAKAAFVYAASDVVRTLSFVVPALLFGTLHAVLIGAAVFAAVRVTAMLAYLWTAYGRTLRLDVGIWRRQLAYALPFELAVGVDVIQANAHQWVVATRFDAAAFAIYAVGCLQIPLVDLICTSTANVMMVKMAELAAQGEQAGLALWHDTTVKLASLMFPLAALLFLTAHGVIVLLFTKTYLASVPILRVWCLMIIPSAFAVDAVLRAHARTRFLLLMNIVRLAVILGLVGWCISAFGVVGAVVATLVGTAVVKALAMARIARLMNVGISEVLPWKRLAATAVHAGVPLVPAWATGDIVTGPEIVTVFSSVAIYGAVYLALWFVLRTHFSIVIAGLQQEAS